MKRLKLKLVGLVTLGVVLAGVGLATWAAPASANGGPHGGYTLTTSACAGCHRAHTAVSPNLVKADSIYGLCTSCHGGLVSTDVVHGVLLGATNTDGVTPRKLNGGGFVQQNGANVTSRHLVEDVPVNGTPFVGTVTAWGSQNGDGTPVADVGVGVNGVLECTSCHNPHGSTNYRILNDSSGASHRWVANDPDILDFVQYQVLATRDDGPNYGFDFTNVADCPQYLSTPGPGTKCVHRYASGVTSSTVVDTAKGMNAFCATCHKSYLTLRRSELRFNSLNTPVATVGPGTPTLVPPFVYPGVQDANDGNGPIPRYRHRVAAVFNLSERPKQGMRFAALGVDPNPSGSLNYNSLGCLTCHYAHGSSAAATPAPGDPAPEGPAGSSALLFYDNRGVCITCHQTVGGVATLTATPVPPTATPTP